MLGYADHVEPEEVMGRRAAGAVSEMMRDFLDGVRSLAAGAQVHDLLEARAVPGNRRIVTRVLIGADVNGRPHLSQRLAEHFVRAFLDVGFPDRPAAFVRRSFDRAVEDDAVIVDAASIVTGVVADGLEAEVESVFARGFDQAVEALEREREVAFAGLSDGDVKRQVVA